MEEIDLRRRNEFDKMKKMNGRNEVDKMEKKMEQMVLRK